MRGAVTLATGYAKDRRQYGQAIGSFQAVQHLLADAFVATEGSRSAALHAGWAVDALAPDDALAAAAVAKAAPTPRSVRDGHPGPRRHRQHLGVPGACAPAPCPALQRRPRRRGASLAGCSPTAESEADVNFGDSPDEAAFRSRLRDWLRDNNPGLPASSTSDDYWAGAALAPRPLRRRVLRHVVAEGHRRPRTADRL